MASALSVVVAAQDNFDIRRNAELESNAYQGAPLNFSRGGVRFNEEETLNGVEIIGAQIGDIHGSEDDHLLDRIWAAVNDLPIKERAFIVQYMLVDNWGPANAFRLSFDVDGKGKRNVLVTVISPLKKEYVSPEIINHESGIKRRLIISNRRVRWIVTSDRVMRFDHDEDTGIERSSISYINSLGSIDNFTSLSPEAREHAIKGHTPVAKTITTRAWYQERATVTLSNLDPYKPIIEKRSVDFCLGTLKTDTYGIFDRPIREVTETEIVYNRFNDFGLFMGSRVYKNDDGKLEGKPYENESDKIARLTPISVNTTDVPQSARDLSDDLHRGYVSYVVRHDTKTGKEIVRVIGNGRFYTESGRTSRSKRSDGATVHVHDDLFYDSPDLGCSLVPSRMEHYVDDKLIFEDRTTNYDPVTRVRTVERTDHSRGDVKAELTFDPRYDEPVEAVVADLVSRLGSGDENQRQLAEEEIAEIGKPAVHGLLESLKIEKDASIRSKLELLLKRLHANERVK